MSQVPSRPGTPRPEQERRLMAVLEEYLAAMEAGGLPDPEEVIRRHPDLAEELRSYLSSLEFLRRAAAGMQPEMPRVPSEMLGESRQLGDYRLLREVGRGGMGVVYEAEQISLGRRVALKVLPMAAVLDERQLQRFRNEAQAAAALHHAHIVPVHGIGCERGIHYYAMQFIEGPTLADVIHTLRATQPRPAGRMPQPQETQSHETQSQETRPTEIRADDSREDESREDDWREDDSRADGMRADNSREDGSIPEGEEPPIRIESVALRDLATMWATDRAAYYRRLAELVIQVAEALDHAHVQGVLHRDIKPSNLILDGAGKVWVTDFGLARMEASPGVTLTGDLVGTLRYMSPEQLLARRGVVDHRSDVYSLGATLYELLTLQPAFPDTDRQDLLRRVALHEPALPRKLQPEIPIELETIVLKAMGKAAVERYATARALADDLRNFLESRPLEARRPHLLQRLAKWSHRHRAAVSTAVVTTILGLTATTAVSLYKQYQIQSARGRAEANYTESRRALTRERQQRFEAEGERQRAEDNLRKAFTAFDRMIHDVAPPELADSPPLAAVRREMLEEALTFYRDLMNQKGSHALVARDVARASHRAGDVLRLLRRYDEASQSVETAVALFGRLARSDSAYRHELARSLALLGRIEQERGAFVAANNALGEALRFARQAASAKPDIVDHQLTVADIHLRQADLRRATNQWQAAEDSYRDALAIHRRVAKAFPDRVDGADRLADNQASLGELLRRLGRVEEAEQALREALLVVQQRAAREPRDHLAKAKLARELKNLGDLQMQQGVLAAASQSYERAWQVQGQLSRQNPKQFDYAVDYAAICVRRGTLASRRGDLPAALEFFEQARGLAKKVLEDQPQHPRARRFLEDAETACEELRAEQQNHVSLKA